MTQNKNAVFSETINDFPCVSCGGTIFDILFAASDFDTGNKSFLITQCHSCNLVRTEPVLTDDQLNQYYDIDYFGSGSTKFSGFAETLTRLFSHRRASSILSHINREHLPPTKSYPKVLDIGCGRGNLLNALKQMGCYCHGTERTEFPTDTRFKDVQIHKEKLEDIRFSEDFFDAVVIWHVLEHLDNPMETIKETARILRPGGVLAIAVPNFDSFQEKVFRANWFHFDLPRHRYHFTSHILLKSLQKNGFAILHKHTNSIEQNLFGFIQSFLNKVVPFIRPNSFYSLLKKTDRSSSAFSLLGWTGLSSLIFPLALLEFIVSGMLGKGATLIIYAKKC